MVNQNAYSNIDIEMLKGLKQQMGWMVAIGFYHLWGNICKPVCETYIVQKRTGRIHIVKVFLFEMSLQKHIEEEESF